MRTVLLAALLAGVMACEAPTAPTVQSTARKVGSLTNATEFSWSCVGLTCDFTAVTGGNVQSRMWFFGDGTTFFPSLRVNVTATHTYAAAGTYTVLLRVYYRTPTLRFEDVTHTVTVP